jgi:hypothetical protein
MRFGEQVKTSDASGHWKLMPQGLTDYAEIKGGDHFLANAPGRLDTAKKLLRTPVRIYQPFSAKIHDVV